MQICIYLFFSALTDFMASGFTRLKQDGVSVLHLPGVALALNVAAASLPFPFTPTHPPPPLPSLSPEWCQTAWMLKESTTAAGGRDKAAPYLHRLNSRINLSTPPLPPWCLSPPYLPPTPPFSPLAFATIHLYSCHDVGNCFLTLWGLTLSLGIET